MSRPDEQEELRARLREATAGFEPDRTRMINRVAAGRSAARSRSRNLRPVLAATSVVLVSVLSVVAVRSVNSSAEVPPVAQAPAVSGSPEPTAGTTKSAPSASVTSKRPHTSTPATPTTPSTTTAQPPVHGLSAKSAIGKDSVATWSECTVTVSTTSPVDELTVSIKVALSANAADAGKYTTVPNSDVTMTVTRGADAMTYTWVLNKKAELIAGKYVFAAQFTHAGGRAWSKDGYQVSAEGTTLSGGFH